MSPSRIRPPYHEPCVEELQGALGHVDGKKATQRPLAAIAHNNGVSQTELGEWEDVQRLTIYSRLKQLDTNDLLEQAERNVNIM